MLDLQSIHSALHTIEELGEHGHIFIRKLVSIFELELSSSDSVKGHTWLYVLIVWKCVPNITEHQFMD